MPRFFVEESQIKDHIIEVTGQDVRHIRDVLRLQEEAVIEICNGQGMDYQVAITHIGQDLIKTKVLEQSFSKAEPETKITLFQSLVKGDKFEWVIQKAIEIGVQQIVPMQTTYCVSKMDKSKKSKTKVKRWNKIAQSAAKQSGRGIIPQVANPVSFKEALELSKEMDFACIAYEKEDRTNLKSYIEGSRGKKISVLIGPEGGFSKEEIDQAQEAHVQAITLGPRILRSETASIVLVSNILYELGEMN